MVLEFHGPGHFLFSFFPAVVIWHRILHIQILGLQVYSSPLLAHLYALFLQNVLSSSLLCSKLSAALPHMCACAIGELYTRTSSLLSSLSINVCSKLWSHLKPLPRKKVHPHLLQFWQTSKQAPYLSLFLSYKSPAKMKSVMKFQHSTKRSSSLS